MRVEINGVPLEVPEAEVPLVELMQRFGYPTEYVAVAINLECVPRSQFNGTLVRENDRIEVLSPHQGG